MFNLAQVLLSHTIFETCSKKKSKGQIFTMLQLELFDDGTVIWHGDKTIVGGQYKRTLIERFLKNIIRSYPCRVLLHKLPQKKKFAFAPILLDGQRYVAIVKYNFLFMVLYENVILWMKLYITRHALYNEERFQFNL